jgi:hypothetical protein
MSGLIVAGAVLGWVLTGVGLAAQADDSMVLGCAPVSIGTGTATAEWPLYTYFQDSRAQCIYLASEVGGAGNITALSLNVTTVPGQVMNLFTIRMKHTTTSAYSTAYLENGGWTTVYQANEPVGSTGWRTFTFTTPFVYNGTDNLMIDFTINNSSSSTSGITQCTTLGAYRTVVKTMDTATDPLNWVGTTNASRKYQRPNVQLTVCTADGPPIAPSDLTYTAHADSILWTWTDASNNENGFYGHDASEAVIWTVAPNTTSYEEKNLTPNTQYARHVHAYSGAGVSAASNAMAAYTLPVAPNVSCDRQANCPAYAVNTVFTFTNLAGFGAGLMDHYSYTWYQGSTTATTESTWSSGTLQLTADAIGTWYLSISSRNPDDNSGGSMTFGPFVISEVPGYAVGDVDGDCDVDSADLDLLADCGSGPGIAQTDPACASALLDADSDVDADDFAIFQRCYTGENVSANLDCW